MLFFHFFKENANTIKPSIKIKPALHQAFENEDDDSIHAILSDLTELSALDLNSLLGFLMSMVQLIIELISEVSKFEQSPEKTDRKVAHLQHCLELGSNLFHSTISLLLVSVLLFSSFSLVPAMIALAGSTCAFLTWDLLPYAAKVELKQVLGLDKKNYQQPPLETNAIAPAGHVS